MPAGSQPTTCALSMSDVRVDWFSGTGKGGQHRNKRQNSCRVTHLDTGYMEMRQGRSRRANLEEALNALANRIAVEGAAQARSQVRTRKREQLGSGARGDKIRTYRFHDDVVVDHRTGRKASLKKIMKGKLELLAKGSGLMLRAF